MPLPRCFFDISINGVPSGRVVFELFVNDSPKTCENFRCLCTGERGEGKTTFKPLHYKGTPIHRVVKGFIVQGGDFVKGDGSGGESIYGGLFKDENLKLKHDKPYLLSMANKGPDTNGSQFFITTRPAPHLDGIHVVFGAVVSGHKFVSDIENQKVDTKSRPYADIRINNSGELVLKKSLNAAKKRDREVVSSDNVSSSSDSSSESESSDEESSEESEKEKKKRQRRKKKIEKQKNKKKNRERKKKKHRKRKKKQVESSGSTEEEDDEEEEPLVEAKVIGPQKDSVPSDLVPSKPSWLYRYSKSPSPTDDTIKKKKRPIELHERDQTVSRSGRKLKGRGAMKYRTPPPDREEPRKDHYRSMRSSRRRSRSRTGSVTTNNRRRSRSRHRSRSGSRSRRRSLSGSRSRHRNRSGSRSRLGNRSGSRSRLRNRSGSRSRRRSLSGSRSMHRNQSGHDDKHVSQSGARDDRYGSDSRYKRRRSKSLSVERESVRRRSFREETQDSPPVRRHSSTRKEEEKERSSTPLQDEKNDSRGRIGSASSEVWEATNNKENGQQPPQRNENVDSDDPNEELEEAYQKVEQTLANQQFGVSGGLHVMH